MCWPGWLVHHTCLSACACHLSHACLPACMPARLPVSFPLPYLLCMPMCRVWCACSMHVLPPCLLLPLCHAFLSLYLSLYLSSLPTPSSSACLPMPCLPSCLSPSTTTCYLLGKRSVDGGGVRYAAPARRGCSPMSFCRRRYTLLHVSSGVDILRVNNARRRIIFAYHARALLLPPLSDAYGLVLSNYRRPYLLARRARYRKALLYSMARRFIVALRHQRPGDDGWTASPWCNAQYRALPALRMDARVWFGVVPFGRA